MLFLSDSRDLPAGEQQLIPTWASSVPVFFTHQLLESSLQPHGAGEHITIFPTLLKRNLRTRLWSHR